MSVFASILADAVAASGAVGAAFAAGDGEVVDAFPQTQPFELAVMAAHYGVVLSQINAALGTMHVGGPECLLVENENLDVIVQTVADGYYAILALPRERPLSDGLSTMQGLVRRLRKEM